MCNIYLYILDFCGRIDLKRRKCRAIRAQINWFAVRQAALANAPVFDKANFANKHLIEWKQLTKSNGVSHECVPARIKFYNVVNDTDRNKCNKPSSNVRRRGVRVCMRNFATHGRRTSRTIRQILLWCYAESRIVVFVVRVGSDWIYYAKGCGRKRAKRANFAERLIVSKQCRSSSLHWSSKFVRECSSSHDILYMYVVIS